VANVRVISDFDEMVASENVTIGGRDAEESRALTASLRQSGRMLARNVVTRSESLCWKVGTGRLVEVVGIEATSSEVSQRNYGLTTAPVEKEVD
jgi:hypothetical protein